jgi:hypothetical protein
MTEMRARIGLLDEGRRSWLASAGKTQLAYVRGTRLIVDDRGARLLLGEGGVLSAFRPRYAMIGHAIALVQWVRLREKEEASNYSSIQEFVFATFLSIALVRLLKMASFVVYHLQYCTSTKSFPRHSEITRSQLDRLGNNTIKTDKANCTPSPTHFTSKTRICLEYSL